jgi:hypothetical protein
MSAYLCARNLEVGVEVLTLEVGYVESLRRDWKSERGLRLRKVRCRLVERCVFEEGRGRRDAISIRVKCPELNYGPKWLARIS